MYHRTMWNGIIPVWVSHRNALIFLVGFLGLGAPTLQAAASDASKEQALPDSARSDDLSFDMDLELPPGKSYVMNVVLDTNATVVAKFVKTYGIEVVSFAHPNSDLVIQADTVSVNCPGLSAHEVKILVDPKNITNNIGIRAKQMGHYGIQWRNTADKPAKMKVHFIMSKQVIITSQVGAEFRH